MIYARMRTCNDLLRKTRMEFFVGATSDVTGLRLFPVAEGKKVYDFLRMTWSVSLLPSVGRCSCKMELQSHLLDTN